MGAIRKPRGLPHTRGHCTWGGLPVWGCAPGFGTPPGNRSGDLSSAVGLSYRWTNRNRKWGGGTRGGPLALGRREEGWPAAPPAPPPPTPHPTQSCTQHGGHPRMHPRVGGSTGAHSPGPRCTEAGGGGWVGEAGWRCGGEGGGGGGRGQEGGDAVAGRGAQTTATSHRCRLAGTQQPTSQCTGEAQAYRGGGGLAQGLGITLFAFGGGGGGD